MQPAAGILILLVALAGRLTAQDTETDAYPSSADTLSDSGVEGPPSRGENLLEDVLSDKDDVELLDELLSLREHPYDLNEVTKEELQTIPGVTRVEAEKIVGLRDSLQRFTSVKQLAVLEESCDDLLKKVEPYLSVGGGPKAFRVLTRATRDVQPRRGFRDNNFLGSPFVSYQRISYRDAEHLRAQVLYKKDAGERTDDGFMSGFVAMKDLSVLSHAIAGDYVIEGGQGLVFWRGSAFGKGGESVSIAKKAGRGPQPYHSADEFNFLRGIAATVRFGSGAGEFSLSGFFSQRRLGATMLTSDSVSGFYRDGMFRTQSEVEKQNMLAERLVGGRLTFDPSEGLRLGVSYAHSAFDKTVVPDRLFTFAGSVSDVVGVDAELHAGRLTLFGEAARSGDAAGAAIAGAVITMKSGVDVAVIYRDYSPRFISLHAQGFGEGSDTRNERGLYAGTRIRAARRLVLRGYVDLFTQPWRTYFNPLPSSGSDMLLQADGTLSSRLELSLRYTRKSTETTEPSVDALQREVRLLTTRVQQKTRLTATYNLSSHFALKGRVEATEVTFSIVGRKEQGLLLFEDIQFTPSSSLVIAGRIVFFDTDSYDSRLYEYESDMKGVFSNQGLFGKGRRWYVLVRYRPSDFLHLSAKYSETQKEGVSSMGSGLMEISGDLDNRVAVQAELWF